ncbi:hypothetical protein [Flavobacterium sp.]|uniref:hypothetical protein n=1 Tax=Flavobacterium sp. TaxID=239 RepID=UPI002B4AE6D8|nr:hypothetical protein [Flavobacterium sp.]HLF51892.1 hypothetical protein [Flavobacterium sp.]
MKKAYSFFRINDTDESHIFEGHSKGSNYKISVDCMCKKITPSQGYWITDAVRLNEQETREKAAEFGKLVCRNCISMLYTTYE